MQLKRAFGISLAVAAALATGTALASPATDIANSLNQVSLSYMSVSPSNSVVGNFNGAQAQVSYMGDALFNSGYLEADASEATADVQSMVNLNDYNYNVRAGRGYMVVQSVALVPYVHLGHEVISAAYDTSTANSIGVGAKALYSPMPKLVLSADLSADHSAGDVSSAVGTPDGLVTAEGVGIDYAITTRVHLSAGYGHRAFSVGGVSASDKIATIGIGMGF